jgi:hypothetical protein
MFASFCCEHAPPKDGECALGARDREPLLEMLGSTEANESEKRSSKLPLAAEIP